MKHFTKDLLRKNKAINICLCLVIATIFHATNCQATTWTDSMWNIDGISYVFSTDGTNVAKVYQISKENTSSQISIPDHVEHNGTVYEVIEIGSKLLSSIDSYEPNKTLTSITLPETITTISSSAFENCLNLSAITICSSKIPTTDNHFQIKVNLNGEPRNSYYKDVALFVPAQLLNQYNRNNSWTQLGIHLYSSSTCSLVNMEDGSQYIFDEEKNTMSFFKGLNEEKYTIPEKVEHPIYKANFPVKEIIGGAFLGMDKLKEVEVPTSIKTVGIRVFWGCPNLERLTFFAEVPPTLYQDFRVYSDLDGYKYKEVFIFVPSTALNAYQGNSKWNNSYNHFLAIGSTFLTAEDGIQYITNKDSKEAEVYKGINEESVTIPETVTIEGNTYTVTTISSNSFADQSDVKNINLPKTLTKLPSSGSICNNNDLTITINSTTPPSGSPSSLGGDEKEVVEESNRYGTYEVTYLATSNTIVFVPSEALDAYKEWAQDDHNIRIFPIGSLAHFEKVNGNKYLIDPESESTTLIRAYKEGGYEIPESIEVEGKTYTVNTIGSYSIEQFCDKIELPNSITNIENYACWDNSGVTILTIPEGITSIGQSAFTFNNLEELTLPSTLKTVGYKFLSSSKIKTVTCKATTPPTFVVPEYFSEDYYLEQYKLKNATLYVPEGTEEAYKVAKGWKLFYTVENTPTNIKAATSNAPKPQIITNGKDIEVTGLDNNEIVSLYNAEGKLQSTAIVHNGTATLAKPATGNLFIIKSKNATIKLAIK